MTTSEHPFQKIADLALQTGSTRACGLESERDIARLRETVERQAAEIEALTRMLEAHPMAKYVETLELKHAELAAQVQKLKLQRRRMLESSSWRVTKPLREAVNFVSRILHCRT